MMKLTTEAGELSNLERELYQEFPKEAKIKEKGLSDLYFKPAFFEKTGRLYEALGVKHFRKYFPNGGSYWIRKGQPCWIKGRKKDDLERFIKKTETIEAIHVLAGLPITAMSAMLLADKDYVAAGIFTLLNLAVNVYPIMSQRYNRNIANKILERLEERETKKAITAYR